MKQIWKYELLRLVAELYENQIEVTPFDDFHCDRSLDSHRFRTITGYTPPSWREMLVAMNDDFEKNHI